MHWKHDRVMVACCFIQIKVFSIKAINTESYSGVMVIAMQYANKSVDKCLLQRLSPSYKQWWFIALPHEEKCKQVVPVS